MKRYCKIKVEYCDCIEELNMIFEVLSVPNANGKVDICPVKYKGEIKPVESIFENQIEYVNWLEELNFMLPL